LIFVKEEEEEEHRLSLI